MFFRGNLGGSWRRLTPARVALRASNGLYARSFTLHDGCIACGAEKNSTGEYAVRIIRAGNRLNVHPPSAII